MIGAVTHSDEYDILIIGGGLVGASLACALRVSGLRVGVIEASPLGSISQPSYDDRTIALAYGSRRIFAGMGVWDAVAEGGAYPIEEIHISDRGHFGATRLHAADAGLEALGYVAANRAIGAALLGAIQESGSIDWICPAEVVGLTVDGDASVVSYRRAGDEVSAHSRLVVIRMAGAPGWWSP